VKAAFPQKLIEMTVSEADETAALLADGARRERLLRAAADVEAGRNVVVPEQSQFR
jgi:PHD/YefM family antitoxin component YafN of YafNO toxin-antitoxin module